MPWRPALALALLVAFAAPGCGGQAPSAPSRSPASATDSRSPSAIQTTPKPTETASPSPALDADVRVPKHAPTSFDRDVEVTALPAEALAPRGAQVASTWATPPGRNVVALAFSWRRGEDPLAAESGFEVWQRFEDGGAAWRAVYAFTDRASSGVLGVRFETGDLTADGAPDALTFEDVGGSGACGTWRVVGIAPGDASEIYSEQTCDTDVRIAEGDLLVREAVFAPGDAHCCPSAYRITTLEWGGDAWDVVDRRTERS